MYNGVLEIVMSVVLSVSVAATDVSDHGEGRARLTEINIEQPKNEIKTHLPWLERPLGFSLFFNNL